MSLKLQDIVGNIFYTDEKEEAEEAQQSANLQQKANNVFGTIDKSETPYKNYEKVSKNSKISSRTKKYIQDATGLNTKTSKNTLDMDKVGKYVALSKSKESESSTLPVQTETTGVSANPTKQAPVQSGTGNFAKSVGKRVANTASYNNNAAKGQCVWYVRGRASEKLGKDPGAIGNANEMYYNAKADAKLSATTSNIKPNIIVSYGKGTSSAGAKYGHVIYIEDVVGDTVYYTEGGSGYYKNGTDGVIKTATREGILKGVNSSGSRMGSNVIGFIDLNKY